jgi:pantetheine-phosphate adenylyltransferase
LSVALYPGSFDPITFGHLDIAIRAANIFDKVVIGVYDLPRDKRLLFNTEERVDLARKSITGDKKNIEVISFSGLTVDFARKLQANVIVRGLRMSADFEREFDMAMMNRNLDPDLELVCFMANLKYQFLSSSLLKEVADLGGNIDNLVPKPVVEAMKLKMSHGKLSVPRRIDI